MTYSTKHIYYKITMPDGTIGVGIRYGIHTDVIKAMIGDTVRDILPGEDVEITYLGMDKI